MKKLPLSKHKVLFNAPLTHILLSLRCLIIQGCGYCPFSSFISHAFSCGVLLQDLVFHFTVVDLMRSRCSHLGAFVLNWLSLSPPLGLTHSWRPPPRSSTAAVAPFYSKWWLSFLPICLGAVATRDYVGLLACMNICLNVRFKLAPHIQYEKVLKMFNEALNWM